MHSISFGSRVMSESDTRFCFLVDWYDQHASMIRRYQLLFYPKDKSVEMYDFKKHRIFLKRTKCDHLTMNDLYIGSMINIFSRQLTVIDYGDDYSREALGTRTEKTLALLTSEAFPKMGEIINLLQDKKFRITKMKMCEVTPKEAINQQEIIDYISKGPVLAMELLGDNAITAWKEFIGCEEDKDISPSALSLIARYENEHMIFGSSSATEAARQLEFFFPTSSSLRKNTAIMEDCTCCVIKPHAVAEGLTGNILNAVLDAGFQITAIQMFYLERANAEEFFEVYKGVVPEYMSMVSEMISGPCIAIAIRAQDAPKAFRDFSGPADPEIACHLRPRSLRALYGKTKIKNAVHCTDLPTDGLLEVEYFFKILDQ